MHAHKFIGMQCHIVSIKGKYGRFMGGPQVTSLDFESYTCTQPAIAKDFFIYILFNIFSYIFWYSFGRFIQSKNIQLVYFYMYVCIHFSDCLASFINIMLST